MNMNLSSQLTYNMHHGAQDLRNLLSTGAADGWLPGSWQDSLQDLSFSVIGLWDSVIQAFSALF
ncbi:hypothetical protein CYJ46_09200 [Corynebacterium coyleae]|nr:hypothetical protein CYJ46_09200 [Corynebacterium coyleae]